MATKRPWWIVTLRQSGDDEDSLYIVQASNTRAAMTKAETQFRKDADIPRRTEKQVEKESAEGCEVYINWVVSCVGQQPEIRKSVLN